MIKVYGIKNCNTVKKALDWFERKNIDYEFHDFKKEGISEDKLRGWAELTTWQDLINRKGTTWRNLSEEDKLSASTEQGAYQLMMEKTSVIKRPVIEKDGTILQGFDERKLENFLV